ncbi:hypothetical protein C5S32_09925 [ANME-1 cluster archaeon GoMg1]|nr:hypothetical protein [ANME-1 cluster archaeon GoMg1]
MTGVVKRTDTFLESLKTIKKNKKALEELDKKINELCMKYVENKCKNERKRDI